MRTLFATLLVALLLGLSAPPLRAETLDEIYAKAKGEGALSIYGGGPARLYEGWVKEYEARFPGIKVTVTGGYAGGLAPAIDKQIAGGRLDVDFVTFQAMQEFIRWKREGVLLPFKMEGFEALDPRFRDPDGAYTPINVFAIAPAFNTKLVTREDAPRSALDFLKPMFRGKLITAYPNDDDATLFAFQTIVKKYGWRYMDDYMATEPKFIQGHLGVVRSVAAGDSLATFDMMLHHTMVEKSEGKPIDVTFPASDALPIWGQLGAIFKDAPHPNAQALSAMVHGEGAAGADRHLVGAQRRSAAIRIETDPRLQRGQRSGRDGDRSRAAFSAAPALRNLYRRRQEQRRYPLTRSASGFRRRRGSK
jgi:ABC-type Fe3+ transport system substrate-binding protein